MRAKVEEQLESLQVLLSFEFYSSVGPKLCLKSNLGADVSVDIGSTSSCSNARIKQGCFVRAAGHLLT